MKRWAFLAALGILGCTGGTDPTPQATSSSSGNVSCLPGQQFPCTCSDGKPGGQVCNLQGNAVGACTCGAGGGGGSSTSSSSSSTSSSSSGMGGAGGAGGGMGGAGGQGGGSGGGSGGPCVPGSKVSCYDGPAATQGVGACAAGSKTCNGSGTGYGACIGQVLPVAENCTTQVDDDCNGLVNEGGAGCSCSPGQQAACYSAAASTLLFGSCHAGQQQCKPDGTGFGPCTGEIDPQPESCDTVADDNCNGKVNEGGPDSIDCVCKPGAAAACYDGPAGTMNLGLCVAGTKTCNALGNAYGPCLGEVTPQQDLCATPDDEDCNNLALPCLDPSPAQQDYGAMGLSGSVTSIASDSSANVIFGGPSGSFDYGGGKVTGNPGVVVKLGSGLDLVWSKGLPGAVQSVAVDATTGDVFATGSFKGSVDFGLGGPPLVISPGGLNSSAFVVKWDHSGQFQWAKPFGGSNSTAVGTGVSVDPMTHNIVVTGTFTGQFVDLGGGVLPYDQTTTDFFVLKLDANTGSHLWSRGFAHGQNVALTTDANGDILLAGAFQDTMVLGLAPVQSLFSVSMSIDGFVAKLAGGDGTFVWARAFGDAMEQRAVGVATDPQRNVLVTGWFKGSVDLGGGALTAGVPGPSMLVTKLDKDDVHVWSKSFGAGTVMPAGVASDDLGNVILTGALTGATHFGGGDVPLGGSGPSSLFAVKLNASDAHVWSYAYGDNAAGTAIATDPSGYVLVAGSNASGGSIVFPGGTVNGLGDLDIVVAKLSP